MVAFKTLYLLIRESYDAKCEDMFKGGKHPDLTSITARFYLYKLVFAPTQGRDLTNSITQKKHTKTLAAIAPAEAGSTGSTVPVVWK
jgi:hypothetical protein